MRFSNMPMMADTDNTDMMKDSSTRNEIISDRPIFYCCDNKLRLSSCIYCAPNLELIQFYRNAEFIDCFNKCKKMININVIRFIYIYFVFGTENIGQ